MTVEESLWVHGKILSDALKQMYRSSGIPIPIGVEDSVRFFDIAQADSPSQHRISVCLTRRIQKEGPGRWCVREDGAVYRFRHQGAAFDRVMDVLSMGFASGSGSVTVSDLNTNTDTFKKTKARVIKRLRNEGAINTADYLQDAICIHSNGTITIHNLDNVGCLIFG